MSFPSLPIACPTGSQSVEEVVCSFEACCCPDVPHALNPIRAKAATTTIKPTTRWFPRPRIFTIPLLSVVRVCLHVLWLCQQTKSRRLRQLLTMASLSKLKVLATCCHLAAVGLFLSDHCPARWVRGAGGLF